MAPLSREEGFFGPPTATIDWCEENYQVSYYVAEFWNTLSNVFIFLPPVFGILEARRQGLENRHAVGYVTLIVIGLGSVLFHMTLRYEMQLMDEVPMVYGTAAIGYCLCQIRDPIGKPPNWRLAGFFFTYCLVFTVAYLALKDPYIHEAMFLVLVFSLILVAIRHNVKSRPSNASLRMFLLGILMYFLGGVTWNLDNHICPQLTSARERISNLPSLASAPLKPLTQLHAWWHFFSGFGTYLLIVSFIGYRLKFLNQDHRIVWTWFGPTLKISSISNGKSNKAASGLVTASKKVADDDEEEEKKSLDDSGSEAVLLTSPKAVLSSSPRD